MSFLLDTNVLSEVRKGRQCNAAVRKWWLDAGEQDLYLSVMVVGEIRRGIERLRDRNPTRAGVLENWLNSVIEGFEDRLLVIDRKVVDVWGSITARRTLPLVDGLLAATAIAHDLVFVTRNTKDISDCGVNLLNPFASQSA